MCKVRLLIVVGLLTINFKILAQIAIDATPDPSATLNIGFPPGPPRGLLIPRGDIGTIPLPPTDYLLFFDTSTPAPNDDQIYYFKTSKWISLNPWKRDDGFNLVTTTNNVDITGNLDISGYVNATGDILGANITATGNVSSSSVTTTGNITATGATSTISATRYLGYTVPPGGVIMYSGIIAGNFNGAGKGIVGTAYEGWALCNGNTHGSYTTPDLRGRFVVGYDSLDADYNSIGITDGMKEVPLLEAQMPSHKHDKGTLTIPSSGSHSHTYTKGIKIESNGRAANDAFHRVGGNYESRTIGPGGLHTHNVIGNTGDTGTGVAHENRPPYWVLAYIMKLP